MSDDQLIDELAGRAELFALEANGVLRRWFTRKLLTYAQAGPPPHDDRADTLAAIALARSLVEECRVALQPQSDTDLRLLLLQDLAVRAAYGALGVHPAALLHDDRADYLLFIVKRRIFAVDRMERGVNDDTVFRYPDGSVLLSKPSKQARPSWAGVIEIPPGSTPRYPFKLSAPTGTGNPASAALLLFEPNRLSADRSTFDCAGAAMAVHIVALLDAADDPSTLATAVSAGERYYTLDHPHGSSGVVDDTLVQGITPVLLADAAAGDHVELTVAFGWNCPPAGSAATLVAPDHEEPITIDSVGELDSKYTGSVVVEQLAAPAPKGSRIVPAGRPSLHLVTDPGPEGLFEQAWVADEDLQIGDHVYVASHPAHRALFSDESPWGGEHSFVAHMPVTRRDALQITGHGVSQQPLRAAMDRRVLVDMNARLDIFREVLRRQLGTPPAPGWTGPLSALTNAAQLTFELRRYFQEPSDAAVAGTCKVYENASITYYPDDRPRPTETGPYETLTFEGTVGSATVDAHAFVLFRRVGIGPDPTDWATAYTSLMRSSTVNVNRPELERFGLFYRDDTNGFKLTFLPLFHTDAEQRSGPRRLRYDDVMQTLYGGPDGTSFVIRPRVVTDESGDYRAALRQKGALGAP